MAATLVNAIEEAKELGTSNDDQDLLNGVVNSIIISNKFIIYN